IGVEALRQKALERSIPDVTHVPSAEIAAGLGGRFEQLRLRHQGAQLPALPLLLERRRSRVQLLELLHQQLPALPLLLERRRSHAQLLKLLHHLPMLDELPLMQIIEVVQEELQAKNSKWFGRPRRASPWCDGGSPARRCGADAKLGDHF